MKIQHFLALAVLSLATVLGARAAVLAGPIANAANGHLYYLLNANTWTASEAEAVGLGGHLVTINDAVENQWVVNTFFPLTGVPNGWLWIGLNDAATERQFVWASGEFGAISIWDFSEPFTTDAEDYAAIGSLSGRWKDLPDTYGLEHPTTPTFGVVEVAVAVTEPATQFLPGSARLNGRVSLLATPTLAWFEWGPSLAYGNATLPQSVGSGGNVVGLSNVLAGLVSGTEYHFRTRASNVFGFFAGMDQTFNLGSQRPGVTSRAADPLSSTSARLKGQVNPRGWPTAAWFEWGTTTSYGNVIGMQDVGQGSSASNLSVVLDGLASGPIYHYRLVATNAFGAVYGTDQTIDLGVVPTKITWTGADPSGYWSTPANWFPNSVPTNGADLVFPGGLPPEDMVGTNDLTDGVFRSITFNQDSRHTIRGNAITLTNGPSVLILNSGTNVMACDLTFSGTPRAGIGGSGELTVIGNVGGGSPHVSFLQLVIRGQFTGGSIRVVYGSLALLGDNPYPVSAEIQGTSSSTLRVEGSQPNLSITMLLEMEVPSCPNLTGDGVIGDLTVCGVVTPDSTLSVKNFGGQGAPNWRVLNLRLNGTNVGEYGKLVVSGDLNLGMVRLLPAPSFSPQPGQVFTIIEKTSPGPIANASLGPEGTITNLNRMSFRVSYVGGDGNDLTLTALGFVAEPVPGLPPVSIGSVAWGDYDNDGRLDFLLAGYVGGLRVSQVWRNTAGGFTNVTAHVAPGLPGVYFGSVAWGDYDNDGRLDFLLTGGSAGGNIAQVWRNTGSGFSNVTASVAPGLPGVYQGSAAWGDYDNDGRLDFLTAGCCGGSQVWRNAGSGFSNVTARVAPGLPGVHVGSVAWGDYDNDGRLDFLLAGYVGAGANTIISQLWRNTGDGFSNVTASVAPGLEEVHVSSAAWGDYDNDSRLDLLLTTSYGSQVWRNTGGAFSNVTASVAPGLSVGDSAAWGDYDNDGKLDFLLMGTTNPVPPQLWRNTGDGFSNVTASVLPGLPGVGDSSIAWGDYDNDGRLDFLIMESGQLWRNTLSVAANAPPAAPTGLSSAVSGTTVSLTWNAPVDDQTPAAGLNYNLRIGTTPGASDVLAPMAQVDGLRLLPALGNAQTGTNAVMNLPFGQYYWSVQAVDTGFAGSPFAGVQQFTIAPLIIEPLAPGNGHFQFSFSNEAGASYAVLGSTDLALPLPQWTELGPPVAVGGGLYRFTDVLATNHAQRFYRLRSQ